MLYGMRYLCCVVLVLVLVVHVVLLFMCCVFVLLFVCRFLIKFVTMTATHDKVLIRIPRIRATYPTCASFKNRKTTRQLTVDFREKDKYADLHQFMTFQHLLGAQLSKLIHAQLARQPPKPKMVETTQMEFLNGNLVETKQWAPEVQKENIRPPKPITMAPLIKKNKNSKYADYMVFKFEPGTVVFEGPHGNILQEEHIDFSQVDVEPVVHLKDVWEFEGTYHVRYFVEECKIHYRDNAYEGNINTSQMF